MTDQFSISTEAAKLIRAFEQDDCGFRFFADFAEVKAPAEVAELAVEMRMERAL